MFSVLRRKGGFSSRPEFAHCRVYAACRWYRDGEKKVRRLRPRDPRQRRRKYAFFKEKKGKKRERSRDVTLTRIGRNNQMLRARSRYAQVYARQVLGYTVVRLRRVISARARARKCGIARDYLTRKSTPTRDSSARVISFAPGERAKRQETCLAEQSDAFDDRPAGTKSGRSARARAPVLVFFFLFHRRL